MESSNEKLSKQLMNLLLENSKKDQMISDLSQQIAFLRNENPTEENIHVINKHEEIDISIYEKKIEELEKKLKQATPVKNTEIKNYEKIITSLRKELAYKQAELESLSRPNNELDSLKANLSKLEKKAKLLSEQNEELKFENANVKNELLTSQRELKEKLSLIKKLNTKLDDLTDQIAVQNIDLGKLTSVMLDNDEKKNTIVKLEKYTLELKSKLDQLEVEKTLTKRVPISADDKETVEYIEYLEKETKRLRDELVILDETIKNQRQTIANQDTAISSFDSKESGNIKRIKDLEDTINKGDTEKEEYIKSIDEENKYLKEKFGTLEEEVKRLNHLRIEKTEIIKNLELEVCSLKEKATNLEEGYKEINLLKKDAVEKAKYVKALENKNEYLKDKFESLRSSNIVSSDETLAVFTKILARKNEEEIKPFYIECINEYLEKEDLKVFYPDSNAIYDEEDAVIEAEPELTSNSLLDKKVALVYNVGIINSRTNEQVIKPRIKVYKYDTFSMLLNTDLVDVKEKKINPFKRYYMNLFNKDRVVYFVSAIILGLLLLFGAFEIEETNLFQLIVLNSNNGLAILSTITVLVLLSVCFAITKSLFKKKIGFIDYIIIAYDILAIVSIYFAINNHSLMIKLILWIIMLVTAIIFTFVRIFITAPVVKKEIHLHPVIQKIKIYYLDLFSKINYVVPIIISLMISAAIYLVDRFDLLEHVSKTNTGFFAIDIILIIIAIGSMIAYYVINLKKKTKFLLDLGLHILNIVFLFYLISLGTITNNTIKILLIILGYMTSLILTTIRIIFYFKEEKKEEINQDEMNEAISL